MAIGCFTGDEWLSLARVSGHPEWLTVARFATLEDRLAHQDVLDAEIGAWTRTRGAPGYSEDNAWLLTELLGLTHSDVQRLAEDGVI